MQLEKLSREQLLQKKAELMQNATGNELKILKALEHLDEIHKKGLEDIKRMAEGLSECLEFKELREQVRQCKEQAEEVLKRVEEIKANESGYNNYSQNFFR